jgi:5-methylcytosine-specific restriction endonuclease McrA
MGRKCKLCGNDFKVKIVIDGKLRHLARRKYCLECSPFNGHNTKALHVASKIKTRKPGMSEWQKKARKERKKALVNLMGGKCRICGYDKYMGSLDFHHVNPKDKSFGVADMGMLRKWDLLVAEATNKCILVCKNCHAEIHGGLHEQIINELLIKN